MPQLDFREALSTPEEKFYSPPTPVAMAKSVPVDNKAGLFARGLGLSRSTWTNIVFVAVASVGGLVCAFYFFNGGELLRAAASWPNEFLYPRPPSTDKIDVGQQPNPVDQFSSATKDPTETSASNKSDGQGPFPQNFWAPDLTRPTTAIGTTNPAPPVVPPGFVVVPPPAPVPPPPTSLLNDLNTLASGADALVQSLYQTATQTVTSIIPKKTVPATAPTTISSVRRKVASTRQKLSVRATAASANLTARSISQNAQQMTTTQVQAPVIQNQTMFGGGMGGSAGVGGVGTVSGVGAAGAAGAVGSVGTAGAIGTIGGPGAVGLGGPAGLGQLGSGLSGLGLGHH